jgi:GT2 family glycosyltransferase
VPATIMTIIDADAPPNPTGEIIGLYGDVLQGWAYDPAHPHTRLIVELFVDGSSVALVRADQFQPESKVGDRFHGFAVKLKDSWLTEAGCISAKVANRECWLGERLQLPSSQPTAPAPVASQVWHTGGLVLRGWVWDPADCQRHVEVKVTYGTNVIARTAANRRHHSLSYKTSQDHSFVVDLPWEYADGKAREFEIKDDLGHPLTGSPILVCCLPQGAEALVISSNVGDEDARTIALLSRLVNNQDLRYPKSASFDHYSEWYDVFQQPITKETVDMPARVGVLIISEGDSVKENITSTSVKAQRHKAHAVISTSRENIKPALDALLNNNCDFIVPVTSGDRLSLHALDHLIPLVSDNVAWGYGDCDCDNEFGNRTSPWLKPVWDLDLFISFDVFTPGSIFGKHIVTKVMAAIKANDEPSMNWDTFTSTVALITEISKAKVAHLPKVLYHRHQALARSPELAPVDHCRRIAITALLKSLDARAEASHHALYPGLIKAHWPMPAIPPKVSIIIPTRDQLKLLKICIETLVEKTIYPNLEIIIVDNQSEETETLAYFSELTDRGIKILAHPHPFNYAAVNNRAASIAEGELLCLLNNDVEIISASWLSEMVCQLSRQDIGVVGAKLLWPNMMVQHGGVVIGVNSLAAHTGNSLSRDDAGYLGFNQITRQYSAVTAACLLVRKSTYISLGGQDEEAFPVAFNDVDFCMKVLKTGEKIVWCASAELVHAESASRGKDDSQPKRMRAQREQQNFIRRWMESAGSDRHYHPALNSDYLLGPHSGLAIPPKKKLLVRWNL